MLDRLKLLSLQAAMFTKKLDLQNSLSMAQGISSAVGGLFSGSPTILPKQPNTPPNVPVIILKSANEKYTCNVASARIDFRFTVQKDPPVDIREIWKVYYDSLKQIDEYFLKKNPTPVWRLGFVAQFFAKLNGSANEHITSRYLNPGTADDTWDVNVNFLNRFNMESLEVNRWIKIRPIRNRKEPEDDSAMIAEVDINTLQEDEGEFSQEEIDAFFEDAYFHIINQDIQKVILD